MDLLSDARQAWERGAYFFTPALKWPSKLSGVNGSPDVWGTEVQNIASVGWKLAGWSVVADHRGNPMALPLFQR